MIQVSRIDNITTIKSKFDTACKRGLMACGSNAEGYAKQNCPVDTGALRNSITHQMSGNDKVMIGTNMEYAAYVELGTGVYYAGGRTTPWKYRDAKGNWHTTSGQRPQPYLKPAITDHTSEYHNLIKDSIENA